MKNNRTEAIYHGENKFFTGKPCKSGHVEFRYTHSGTCAACIQAPTKCIGENCWLVSTRGPTDHAPEMKALKWRVWYSTVHGGRRCYRVDVPAGTHVPDFARLLNWG